MQKTETRKYKKADKIKPHSDQSSNATNLKCEAKVFHFNFICANNMIKLVSKLKFHITDSIHTAT